MTAQAANFFRKAQFLLADLCNGHGRSYVDTSFVELSFEPPHIAPEQPSDDEVHCSGSFVGSRHRRNAAPIGFASKIGSNAPLSTVNRISVPLRVRLSVVIIASQVDTIDRCLFVVASRNRE